MLKVKVETEGNIPWTDVEPGGNDMLEAVSSSKFLDKSGVKTMASSIFNSLKTINETPIPGPGNILVGDVPMGLQITLSLSILESYDLKTILNYIFENYQNYTNFDNQYDFMQTLLCGSPIILTVKDESIWPYEGTENPTYPRFDTCMIKFYPCIGTQDFSSIPHFDLADDGENRYGDDFGIYPYVVAYMEITSVGVQGNKDSEGYIKQGKKYFANGFVIAGRETLDSNDPAFLHMEIDGQEIGPDGIALPYIPWHYVDYPLVVAFEY